VEFTREDKLKALERELAMRRRVYPRFIKQGSMTVEQARREIAVMEAIAADYGAQSTLL
jgi:phosphoenolpyruvate carboxylase